MFPVGRGVNLLDSIDNLGAVADEDLPYSGSIEKCRG